MLDNAICNVLLHSFSLFILTISLRVIRTFFKQENIECIVLIKEFCSIISILLIEYSYLYILIHSVLLLKVLSYSKDCDNFPINTYLYTHYIVTIKIRFRAHYWNIPYDDVIWFIHIAYTIFYFTLNTFIEANLNHIFETFVC